MKAKLEHRLDLVMALVTKDLKLRYKSTVLGYAWSVLNPLAMALVFFFAFRVIARIDSDNPYILVLVTGLFPWQWFTNSVGGSVNYFISVSNLIKKNQFPKLLVVFSGVAHDGLHYLVSIPVILAFMVWFGYRPSWSWLWWMPLLSIVTFISTFGLSAAVGTVNVFFRDLERLIGVLLTVWFYLSPVMFEIQMFEKVGLAWVLYLNPMGATLICWRSMFLEGTVSPLLLGVAVAWSVVMLLFGLAIYRRYHWRFAELV